MYSVCTERRYYVGRERKNGISTDSTTNNSILINLMRVVVVID